MYGEDYLEAKTPGELYQRVKLDWEEQCQIGSGVFFRYIDEAQQAALRLRAENAGKNLPPVPSSGKVVDLLNWCIEAQKAFAQAPGGKAPTAEGKQAEGRLPHDERLARVLAFIKSNPDLPEREVARQTGIPASTFRPWPEYLALRKMLAGKVPSGHKNHDGRVEAYD